MQFILTFQLLILHSLSDAGSCPLPGKRRWLVELGDAFTSLINDPTNAYVVPRSKCLPLIKSPECKVSHKKQTCIGEIKIRNEFEGHLKLPNSEKQKCYLKVQLRKVKLWCLLFILIVYTIARTLNEHSIYSQKSK